MKHMLNHIPIINYLAFLSVLLAFTACEDSMDVTDGLREIAFKATANKLVITEGDEITYIDSSLNVASRAWSFEGGTTTTSDQESVTVVYPEPSLGAGGEVNNGYLTELEVTYPDGTVESNGFKVRVFPTVNPEFEADKLVAMFGSTVNFFDRTKSGRSAFEDERKEDTILWEFEGGIPATSTERNPSVRYPEVGNYSVKLTIFRSVPESIGSTTQEEFIEIRLTPPCDNSINLIDCNNSDGESESLAEWVALGSGGEDKTANFTTSTERFTEGTASLKFSFDEPGKPAFTNNFLRFVNASFTVAEEGAYTVSMDVYADIMSSGTDYVFEISTPLIDTTNDGPTKQFFRTAGGAWFNAVSTKNLAPGEYYIQIKMWNTPWHLDMKYDMYLDNISVVRN